ncbi:phasin family protein [uncultured Methylobacterium sp.]|uniref:phasin family protein n=1 Tax=uncultured Methylobacterium sp. TaxID=157278 RepID=UPI0035C9F2CE
MGRQRTPQGRSSGRDPAPPRKPRAGAPEVAEAIRATVPEPAPAIAGASPPTPQEPVPGSMPEPLHARLMDTASPEVLAAAAPAPEPVKLFAAVPVPADANLSDVATPDALPMPEAAPLPEAAPTPDAAHVPERAAAPASDRYANVVPLKAPTPPPARPAVPDEPPAPPSDHALPSPASWRAGRRAATPLRQDLGGLGETLFAFMRSESSATLAHLQALRDARSPADAIRLQVSEIQRAADASLTCWTEIARRATRIVAHR